MKLDRRDRLSNIILNLSRPWPHAPRFSIGTICNGETTFADQGRETLDLLRLEALEKIARDLLRDRRAFNRRRAENERRARYSQRAAAE